MGYADALSYYVLRLRLKCDGTSAENRFLLSAKRTSPFKSAGASAQSTAGSRVIRISGSNAGYTMFRGSVKSTGYPLHSPVFPSLPLLCVTVCHQVSTGLYHKMKTWGSEGFVMSGLSIKYCRVMDQTKMEWQMSLAAGHRQRCVWPGQGTVWLQRFGWTNKMFTCYVFITC